MERESRTQQSAGIAWTDTKGLRVVFIYNQLLVLIPFIPNPITNFPFVTSLPNLMYALARHPEASGGVLVSLPKAPKNASASLSRRTNVTRPMLIRSFAPWASNGKPRKLQDALSRTRGLTGSGLGLCGHRDPAGGLSSPLVPVPLSENRAAGKHPEGFPEQNNSPSSDTARVSITVCIRVGDPSRRPR
jgi:hypothetical protein